jgi:hypothetical protein
LSSDYTIILSGDCFILFEHINDQNAKIVFWCSLYAITDIQIIQSLKSVTINFLEIKQNKDFILKLIIENIVLFRDTLITRMNNLKIKISIKIIDLNSEKNEKGRLTIKEINKMSLSDVDKNIDEMKQLIDKGEINEYSINTFATLCVKAVELLSISFDKEIPEKQKKYLQMIDDVYKFEKIQEVNKNDTGNVDLNINKDKNCENLVEENKNEINNIINKNDDKSKLEEVNKNKSEI